MNVTLVRPACLLCCVVLATACHGAPEVPVTHWDLPLAGAETLVFGAPQRGELLLVDVSSAGLGAQERVTLEHPFDQLVLSADGAELLVLSSEGGTLTRRGLGPGAADPVVVDLGGHYDRLSRDADESLAVAWHPTGSEVVGILPDASRVAVMLDDPTGWLTLIDAATGEVQQINSFELNSQVR